MEAGLTVSHEPGQHGGSTIAIVDLDDCKDLEFVQVHQSRGIKIVALKSETDGREIGLDEIAHLSGILTALTPLTEVANQAQESDAGG